MTEFAGRKNVTTRGHDHADESSRPRPGRETDALEAVDGWPTGRRTVPKDCLIVASLQIAAATSSGVAGIGSISRVTGRPGFFVMAYLVGRFVFDSDVHGPAMSSEFFPSRLSRLDSMHE